MWGPPSGGPLRTWARVFRPGQHNLLPSRVTGFVASPARPRRGVCSDVQAGRLRTTPPATPVAAALWPRVSSAPPTGRGGHLQVALFPCTWPRVFSPWVIVAPPVVLTGLVASPARPRRGVCSDVQA